MSIGKRSRRQVDAHREIVFERDNHTCVVSNSLWSKLIPCGGALTIQHRVTRGMGGSAKYDDPPYLLAMCAIHNALEPASVSFRDFCERQGYSVPRWVMNRHAINRVPVKYDSDWYLLSGTDRFKIPERTAVEMLDEIYGN
jgi:hypothetical protein